MVYEILWRVHAILISSSVLAAIAGVFISVVHKKKKWRHRVHKTLGIYAGISAVTAIIIAVIMVQITKGRHFTTLHGLAGGIAAVFFVLTPMGGLLIRKVKKKKLFRLLHRITGWITLAAAVTAVFFGLILTGIINTSSNNDLIVNSSAGNSVSAGGVDFRWEIREGYIYGTLHSAERGWVSVGFNPESMMQGADFVIAYVEQGEVFIRDDYGSWLTSHAPDIGSGGTDDAEIVSGFEDETGTTVKFRKPLVSTDDKDHDFVNGEEIPVIFAFSRNDGFKAMHAGRGKAYIKFDFEQ